MQLKGSIFGEIRFLVLHCSVTFFPMEPVLECDEIKSADLPGKTEEGGIFTCTKCGLQERYFYKGRNPPSNKKIVFLEDCYVMKDPFSPPNKNQFLLLGSECSLCNKAVCQSPNCSIFYTRRFCRSCAEENMEHFPAAVQIKLKKKPSAEKCAT